MPEPGPTEAPMSPAGPAEPWPTAAPSLPSPSSEFQAIREAESQLVTANASWHAPKALKVEQTQRIGLEIGQSASLSKKINQLLPHTSQSSAGPVTVGPLVRARLEADPNDADVTPSDSVDYSTASNPELLWTWMVRPKRPTTALVLTAHLEVPLAGSANVLPTDIPFQIPVDRTLKYTVGQIFTSWKTWTAVGATVLTGGAAGFRWWTRRRQGLRAVKCPKCGTRQNIPADQSTVDCWQCKQVSIVPRKRRGRRDRTSALQD
jgi:hypothetical protein